MEIETRLIEVGKGEQKERVEVSAVVGTGLAYRQQSYGYDVLHVRSSWAVTTHIRTEREAQRIIECLQVRTNWNKSQEEVIEQTPDLYSIVWDARQQVSQETDALIRKCFDTNLVRLLDRFQHTYASHTSLQGILTVALYDFITNGKHQYDFL